MLVLLDECIPRRLRAHLGDHDVRTVQELGLVGQKNGVLLRRAGMAGVEAFVTVDRNIEFQVNRRMLPFGIDVLHAHTNEIDVLQRLTPRIRAALADKRGSGRSTGDWATASFADLAGDLISGIRMLRTRRDIVATQVGAGGSSQAGWITAKAVTQCCPISRSSDRRRRRQRPHRGGTEPIQH